MAPARSAHFRAEQAGGSATYNLVGWHAHSHASKSRVRAMPGMLDIAVLHGARSLARKRAEQVPAP